MYGRELVSNDRARRAHQLEEMQRVVKGEALGMYGCRIRVLQMFAMTTDVASVGSHTRCCRCSNVLPMEDAQGRVGFLECMCRRPTWSNAR
jgi:hypothetical protein